MRSILITGCSTGIGRVCAMRLQASGYRVFASARSPADLQALDRLALEPVYLDNADERSIRAAVQVVLSRTDGRLDAVFCNAGYGQPGAIEDLPIEAWRRQFEVNLFGTVALIRCVLPPMRAAGRGRILINSSVLGFAAMPYRGAYNASKFALEGMADTLRHELHGTGIQVSLLQPGPIETRFRATARAMFHRAVAEPQASPHRDSYRRMEARLDRPGGSGRFTLPAEALVRPVLHALESPRPRARYRITLPTRVFAVFKRWLPDAALDAILRRIL